MKNLLRIFICLVLVIILSGCGKKIVNVENKNNEDKLGELLFSVPVKFVKDKDNTTKESTYYSYTSKDGKESCFLAVFYSDVFTKDLNKLVKENLYGTGDVTVSDKTINGKVWKVASAKENDVIMNYSNVIIHNNKYYSVSYNDIGKGTYCSNSYNSIINSLRFN